MAHPTIKQTRTFTNHFKVVLQLSQQQIERIDELDYRYYQRYVFSGDANYSKAIEKIKYIRALISILNQEQLAILKSYQKQRVKEQNLQEAERKAYQITWFKKKYSSLGLSIEDLHQFERVLESTRREVLSHQNKDAKSGHPEVNFQEHFLRVVQPRISSVLTATQLQQFLKIEERDYLSRIKLRVELIKDQHKEINLSDDQAQAIYAYEENVPTYDAYREYYSEWEQLDLEIDFMKTILTSAQFEHYELQSEVRRESIRENSRAHSQHQLALIERAAKRMDYIIDYYLPVQVAWRTKIDALLSEKLRYRLTQEKQNYIDELVRDFEKYRTRSIRHYREYAENDIALKKLEIQIRALLPCAQYNKDHEVNVLSHLPVRVWQRLRNIPTDVKAAENQLRDFTVANYEATGGTYGGNIIVIRKGEPHQEAVRQMSLLLLESTLAANLRQMQVITERISKR